jgi:hypothetical protein
MFIGGGSIFLIALGAILTFAVNDQTAGPLDLNVVGWILMLAGLAGLIISLYAWSTRRTRVVTSAPPPSQADYIERPVDRNGVVEERRYTQRNY